MSHFTLAHRLPGFLSTRLFGDRRRYGLVPQPDDACWQEWQRQYMAFYGSTQKKSFGKRVNDAGYRILRRVDWQGKTVLEVGPGDIQHVDQWNGRPARYVLADIYEEMLTRSAARLDGHCDVCEQQLLDRDGVTRLPFADGQFDVVVSFYSLEHIHPLDPALAEFHRVLRPGGQFVGAIPTEGGLAWGLGRLVTSRRWLKKNTNINPDKLICWEHPNYAETVLKRLDHFFQRVRLAHWPCRAPSVDLNLIVSFIYEKPAV